LVPAAHRRMTLNERGIVCVKTLDKKFSVSLPCQRQVLVVPGMNFSSPRSRSQNGHRSRGPRTIHALTHLLTVFPGRSGSRPKAMPGSQKPAVVLRLDRCFIAANAGAQTVDCQLLAQPVFRDNIRKPLGSDLRSSSVLTLQQLEDAHT